MKTKLVNIENAKILTKEEQVSVKGGFWGGGTECDITGCYAAYPNGGQGFVGREGGPCALDTHDDMACIGTVRNGLCCIG